MRIIKFLWMHSIVTSRCERMHHLIGPTLCVHVVVWASRLLRCDPSIIYYFIILFYMPDGSIQ